MLRICAASPRGRQLLQSNPNLLWFISPHLLFLSGGSPQKIHDLLGLKKRNLLEMACGRNDSWLPAMLEKVQVQDASQEECLQVRRDLMSLFTARDTADMYRNPPADFQEAPADITSLQHIKKISPYLLGLAAWWGNFLNTPIIRSILCSGLPCERMENLMSRQAALVGAVCIEQDIPASSEEISAAWQHWKPLFLIYERWEKRHEELPLPPIPGENWIEPITTADGLQREGKEMHHCVASYLPSIIKRKTYIYKVMQPRRATLEIVYDETEKLWKIQKLKGNYNQEVHSDVHFRVEDWLRENQAVVQA